MARDSRRSSDFAASIHGSVAIACDACDPHSVQAAFSQVRRSLGAVDTLVYNAGNGVWGDALTVSVEAFEAAWRVNTLGAFMAARELEVRPFGEKW
jgi:NAD(P)-dependent dehydrogenase (short-subunit alcohol dehydrogenase family)